MGTLFIVATPIGNLLDITPRATQTLTACDTILCEDTRRTGMMLATLSIPHGKLQSYYDQVEDQRIPEIIQSLEEGKKIALVSDAGTPLVSDPGYRLVRECVKRNIPVVSIPGASAILTALTSSGMPSNSFMFLGYPPEKSGARLETLRHVPKKITVIFYCAPHKLRTLLTDMLAVYGDIDVSICRELTKIHEESRYGTITDAIGHFSEPKGEFVLLYHLD